MIQRISHIYVSLVILCTVSSFVSAQKRFIHPGITSSRAELDFIKAKVNSNQEPWASGYKKMMSDKVSSLSYTPRPCPTIGFNICNDPIREDSASIYSHALQYYIKGNVANAEKARSMLNAWAEKNTSILPNGSGGGCLVSAWGFPRMVAGAEILRASYSGWTASEIGKFSNYLDKLVFDKSTDCRAGANNHEISGFANGLMIAIFLDDAARYEKMLQRLLDFVPIYIIDPKGCTKESDRDQPHTMMGIGFMAWGAEAAHHQGNDDVYNALNRRLYTSYEYVAKYNLGHSVDESGCQKKISSNRRGSVGHTIWEVAYNHYHNRLKLPMPWTEQYVKKIRPEQLPDQEMPWGTLTHAEVGNLDATGPSPDPSTTFSFSLAQGWNLISTPLQPNESRIETVLAGIAGKYSALYAYDTAASRYSTFIPGSSDNDLSGIEAGHGYWIYMNSNATLEVKGKAPSKRVDLKAGWNLVGYNSTQEMAVDQALATVAGRYSAVYAFDIAGNSYQGYLPGAGDNALTRFQPGRGYWIYTSGPVEWSLP